MLFSRGNKKLPKETLIWNLPSGKTCPSSTPLCTKWCYAKKAERLYPNVLPSRIKKFKFSKSVNFVKNVIKELTSYKFNWEQVRIHESGDFYSQKYLNDWFKIINKFNNKIFYCYTKSYQLDWSNYQNSFILTDDAGFRVIELIFYKKFTWN